MITVLGSLHWDVVVAAPRLPGLDETLMGDAATYRFGGKGGNQAVAAVRAGGRVAFLGAVGNDEAGPRLLAALAEAGVDASGVVTSPGPSGMSVAIDTTDGYGAVVVSGANLAVTGQGADPATRVALIQNEVLDAANRAFAAALPESATLILNAAPAREVARQLLDRVDILVVNRVEAVQMGGLDALRAQGTVIETRGAEGCLLATPDDIRAFPAHPADPVSTHGAGDAFCGALAAALAERAPIEAAIDRAQAFAAAHVSKRAR